MILNGLFGRLATWLLLLTIWLSLSALAALVFGLGALMALMLTVAGRK